MNRHQSLHRRVTLLLALFTLLLVADGTAASAPAPSRADAISRGFGGSGAGAEAGTEFSIDGRWLAIGVMLATAGVAVGIGLWQIRKWHRRRRTSAAGVESAVGRTLRLSRRERLVLRRAAAELGVAHPATLLLCPSVLSTARVRLGPADAGTINLILSRLAM